MLRTMLGLSVVVFALAIEGAEIQFDFRQGPLNETPRGFRSLLFGQGQPGEDADDDAAHGALR